MATLSSIASGVKQAQSAMSALAKSKGVSLTTTKKTGTSGRSASDYTVTKTPISTATSTTPSVTDLVTKYKAGDTSAGAELTKMGVTDLAKYTATPTVVTGANINESVIPDANAKANEIKALQNAQIQTPETKTTKDTSLEDLYSKMYGGTDASTAEDIYANSPEAALIKQMQKSSDANTNRLLESLNAEYEKNRKSAVETQAGTTAGLQTSLLMSGSSRYAPFSSTGIMSAKGTYDIEQLNDLAIAKTTKEAEILDAQSQNNFKLLSAKLGEYEKIKTQQQEAIKQQLDDIREENKAIATAKAKEQEDITKVLLDSAKNGAPKEVREAVGKATTLAEAVDAAGDYLQSGTGIIGEYQYYKKDAIASGLSPLSFDEYQTRDANRKVSIAKAGSNAAGLTPSQQFQFEQSLASKLTANTKTASDLKRQYSVMQAAVDSAEKGGNLNAATQAVIKTYNLILEPNSVVRETEYAMSAQGQSLADKIAGKYTTLSSGGGGITKKNLREFSDLAGQFLKNAEESANQQSLKTAKSAQNYGLNLDNIMTPAQIANLKNIETSTKDDILFEQKSNEDRLISNLKTIKTTDPKLFNSASKMMTGFNTITKKPYTAEEILQAFPELNK